MNKWTLFLCVFAVAGAVNASWYWPFGEDKQEPEPPRLSELMSDATRLIDDATELAAEGKIQESVAMYRQALAELAKVEYENPDRAATTEFASLRNKRAYVNAAIDALLLAEARSNAKAVSVTDTTELEKKYLEKKGAVSGKDAANAAAPAEAKSESAKPAVDGAPAAKKPAARKAAGRKPKAARGPKKTNLEKIRLALEKDPKNRKLRLALIGEHIRGARYDEAKKEIEVLLESNMTDSSALNLRAVCEASLGDFKSAEKTLDLAIQSNPRDYNGYYNMANLKLQGSGNKDIARRYYETGRALGGPRDEKLEDAVR